MSRVHLMIGRLVVGLSLVTACSSGDSTSPPPAPPPAPVVTAVEVAPASATLNVGDSVPLTATVKDQNGAVMSGKTVTWSSAAQAVATVSTTGVVTAVGAGSATVTATVESKTGSSQVTVSPPAPLVIDPAKAVNDSIGPNGGTLTATGANGVVFTLTIPPHALLAPRRI